MKFETVYCLMINLYDYERRWNMMPLTFMNIGETKTITKVGGKNETRQFLEKLGFVVGGEVTVVSEINGNMIVNIKDSRVAIGKDMAAKIMV
jgi:ferrous iron transport protein A